MISRICSRTELYEYQVKKVLQTFVMLTITDLIAGKPVHFYSLGKFWLKEAKAQIGWNPASKKRQALKRRFIPKFKYGKKAYDFIRNEAEKLERTLGPNPERVGVEVSERGKVGLQGDIRTRS